MVLGRHFSRHGPPHVAARRAQGWASAQRVLVGIGTLGLACAVATCTDNKANRAAEIVLPLVRCAGNIDPPLIGVVHRPRARRVIMSLVMRSFSSAIMVIVCEAGEGCAVCGPNGQWLHNRRTEMYSNLRPWFIPNRRNSKCNLVTGVVTRTDFSVQCHAIIDGSLEERPWLRPDETRVDGLFFRFVLRHNHYHEQMLSNPASVSRQTQFDFNAVLDRTTITLLALRTTVGS